MKQRPSVCYLCGAPRSAGPTVQTTQFRRGIASGLSRMPWLDGQLAGLLQPPYHVDYVNTRKDKHRGKHRPILNDDLGGDLAGASRLDR